MIFDAHADILTDMYISHKNGLVDSFKERHLELYKKGGITHSIFVNWTYPKTDDKNMFADIFKEGIKELRNNPDIFHIVKEYKDLDIATKEKKIGVIIGMEGVMQLKDLNHLEQLYNNGVRHASLTWNEVNKYASGLDGETEGLTELGIALVRKMESLGMIIDLAHSNSLTFDDILENTTKPIIISHGNTKALCNHRRNYTDEQLQKIKARNGVIGICGIGAFISEDESISSVALMADHIDYAVKLIGIDHVGLGLDICYYLGDGKEDNGVDGFKTIADTSNLTDELTNLGYNKDDIHKIYYSNFARIVKDILQ